MSALAIKPLGVLARAQDSFGIAPNAPANEWPFNLLSQQAVRYAGGRIGRAGDPVPPAADPAEQRLCDTISEKAAEMVNRIVVRPADAVLEPFRIPAVPGEPVATEVTPDFVRAAFRGTLHPWAKIEVTSLTDARSYDLSGKVFGVYPMNPNAHNAAWKTVWNWFKQHPDLTGGGWWVSVVGGVTGAQTVQLVVGLTKAGSLVGFATSLPTSGINHAVTPTELYRQLREFELEDVRQWLDGGSGRAVARVILRTFPSDGTDPWDEGGWAERLKAATDRLRQKHRAAYWRSEFHKLPAERKLVLPPAWEAVQRCVTTGRWDSHWHGDPRPFLDRTQPFGEFERGGDGFSLFDADTVRRTADWLVAHDEGWLKAKYADLRATDYAPYMSEADWRQTAEVYAKVVEFYRHAAANGLVVVSEVTARTDEEIASETANPLPPATPTPPGACPVDETLLAPLLECMECYGVEGEGDWPHNDLSPRIVRFACGNIAREGEDIPHDHEPGEVERCQQIATEAEGRLALLDPPHDQGGPYRAFFSAANRGEPVPEAFTEGFVRERLFRGTVNPEVGVCIEPLTADRVWSYDGRRARGFVDWFHAQPGLHGFAFVSIGLSEDEGGASHPRLAVALTDRGSVVGVCGYVIWA